MKHRCNRGGTAQTASPLATVLFAFRKDFLTMKELSSAQVRQMYLDFFKGKGHDVMKSAPLVPHDDPTLLWINSGVATMKKYFDALVR